VNGLRWLLDWCAIMLQSARRHGVGGWSAATAQREHSLKHWPSAPSEYQPLGRRWQGPAAISAGSPATGRPSKYLILHQSVRVLRRDSDQAGAHCGGSHALATTASRGRSKACECPLALRLKPLLKIDEYATTSNDSAARKKTLRCKAPRRGEDRAQWQHARCVQDATVDDRLGSTP
jgi:hypothetical protein